MNKPISFLLFLSLVFFLSPNALAWDKTGHQIITELAVHFLSNPAKQNLKQCLGIITPQEAGIWMDAAGSNPAHDSMKSWHYIYFGKGQSYMPSKEDNIINHLQGAYDALKKRETLSPGPARTETMVLLHLVGDLHQPLHVGYNEDDGGNSVPVTFGSKSTTLHGIWDDEIIRDQKITYDDCQRLFNTLSVAQRDKIKSIDFTGWMNESRALLPAVYDFTGNTIDAAYAQKNRLVILRQLLYAGMRLASVLEPLFSTGAGNAGATNAPGNVPAQPAKIISPEEAIKHIGEQATVCGKVYGGKYLNKSNGVYTFIHIGGRAPGNPFTVVIIGGDRANFSYKPESYFDGKQICVTGTVTKYAGKAQIVVSKEEQIKLQ